MIFLELKRKIIKIINRQYLLNMNFTFLTIKTWGIGIVILKNQKEYEKVSPKTKKTLKLEKENLIFLDVKHHFFH